MLHCVMLYYFDIKLFDVALYNDTPFDVALFNDTPFNVPLY